MDEGEDLDLLPLAQEEAKALEAQHEVGASAAPSLVALCWVAKELEVLRVTLQALGVRALTSRGGSDLVAAGLGEPSAELSRQLTAVEHELARARLRIKELESGQPLDTRELLIAPDALLLRNLREEIDVQRARADRAEGELANLRSAAVGAFARKAGAQ